MYIVLLVCVLCLVVSTSAALYVVLSLNKLRGASTTGVKQNARRRKDYPMSFPKGWFKLMDSKDLKPGDQKHVECLGMHVVVFRGRDNHKVGVLDAFCIHLGANLAVGGKVVGDCIQCPFHLWEWDTNGKCQKIPYQKNVPDRAQTTSFPCIEYYGLILMYFDSKMKAPTYVPPPIPELDSGDMVYSGNYRGDIGMHLIEIAENSADFNHFETLHGTMSLPYTTIPLPFIKIIHTAAAEYGTSTAPHLIQFSDKAHIKVFGKEFPQTTALAEITFVGPSSLMIFQFNTPAGKIVLFQTHLPTDPLNCQTEFVWFAEKRVWRAMAWYVVGNWISQWRNDVAIWENKTFMRRPFLVKGDGPIMKLRRWMFQFYDMETVAFDDDEAATTAAQSENKNTDSTAKPTDTTNCIKRNVGCNNKELEW